MSIRTPSRRRVSSLLPGRALVLAGFVAAVLVPAAQARADEDALAPYRDRFRLGMERYKAGAMAEAIRVWTAIYEEIGPKRGYRLSFDLGRAYDTNGEATRAAERYRSFLDEVGARRKGGEAIEPLVEREAHDAEERMTILNRDHGRIEVDAGPSAVLAQVDDTDPRLGTFTAYVAPGKHAVTFAPGTATAERVELTVSAGEQVVTHAPMQPPPWPQVAPADPRASTTVRATRRPFSPVILYVGAAATAVSIVAPVLAFNSASDLANTYNSGATNPADRTAAYNAYYGGARTLYYGMLSIPIALGAITGGLTVWYFAGTTEREVPISLEVVPLPHGGSAAVTARF